jgi:hypothetical protein
VTRRASLSIALLTGVVMLAAVPAGDATTRSISRIAVASVTPRCTVFADGRCVTRVRDYTYTDEGACPTDCLPYPRDPIRASLVFTATHTWATDLCKVKSGTGTLRLTFPNHPGLPSATGTFRFKARDSKTLTFSGHITTSTVSVLFADEPVLGRVGYPANPCFRGQAPAFSRHITASTVFMLFPAEPVLGRQSYPPNTSIGGPGAAQITFGG